MPFQDQTDFSVQAPRQAGVVERWLRRIFVEDLGTKLLALAITLVLWFAVTGQKTPMTTRVAGVQLIFNLAEGMEIGNDPPGRIDVTLTGSQDKLAQIKPTELVATVSVADLRPGDRVVRLSADRVKLQLPDGVRVEHYQPTTISLRLEPRVERTVPVEVKLEGKVAEGFEVYGSRTSPSMVRLRGPADHVNPIVNAPTESISLDSRKESFDLTQTSIDIPDQKIDVLDTAVNVHVEIGQRGIERTFNDVHVRRENGSEAHPNTATVTLYGAPSILLQLRSEDLKILVEANGNNPRLELPQGTQDQVKLRSIKPTHFSAAP